jgi:hypothetical protein
MDLIKATADSESGVMPSMELIRAMGAYNQELVEAGLMLDGDSRTVIDGPFEATSELVAGYWLWQVKDMDEAIEWVKRCPNPMPGPSEVEIRPLYVPADFAEAMTPELADR